MQCCVAGLRVYRCEVGYARKGIRSPESVQNMRTRSDLHVKIPALHVNEQIYVQYKFPTIIWNIYVRLVGFSAGQQ